MDLAQTRRFGRSGCGRRNQLTRAIKRLVDVCGSAVLLVVTAPMTLAVACLIRCRMGRPVLFRQKRGGYRGSVFVVYKFRTMTEELRDALGNPVPNSERCTALGTILRRFSIDEIPQLWNVLRGDMSLIGPRPLLASYLPRYNAFQRRRHAMRPGLSGLAQVSGRNTLTWEDKFRLDVLYVDSWSLLLDFRIALKTLRILWSGQGASDRSTPAEIEFAGSS